MQETTTGGRDNLQYVFDMLGQLSRVATADGGPFLIYLIELARHEAEAKLGASGQSSQERRETRPPE